MALTKISTGMLKADAASVDLNIDAGTLFLDVANNRVGVANTSPSVSLHVSGGAGSTILNDSTSWSYLRLKSPNANGGYIQFADADDDDVGQIFYYHGSGGDYMSFTTGAAERMRINSSGNVGIGTTNPQAALHAVGNILSSGTVQIFPSAAGAASVQMQRQGQGTAWSLAQGNTTTDMFEILRGASSYFAVNSSGNVGIGTTTPGRKLSVETTGTAIVSSFKRSEAANAFISFLDSSTSSDSAVGVGAAGDTLFFRASNVEHARLNNTGLGIGTTSPAQKLHVEGDSRISSSGFTRIQVNSTRTGATDNIGGLEFMQSGTLKGQIFGSVDGQIKFAVNGSTEAARIDSGGRLLINTTTSIDNFAKLQIVGDSSGYARLTLQDVDGTNQKTYFQQSGGGTAIITQNGTSNGFFDINGWNGSATTQFFRIGSTGKVGIGTTNPDATLRIDNESGLAFKVTGGAVGNAMARFVRDVGGSATVDISGSGGDPQIIFTSTGNSFAAGVNGSRFEIADHTTLGTNARLVIDTAGQVGIGTTGPDRKLHLYGTGGTVAVKAEAGDTSQASLDLKNSNSWFRLIAASGTLSVYDQANTTERFRISSAGYVGIGTAAPERSLHVKSASAIVSAKFETANTAGHLLTLTSASTGASHAGAYNGLRFYNGDGFNMAITHITESSGDGYIQIGNNWSGGNQALAVHSAGNVGIGTTAPDSKLTIYNAATGITGLVKLWTNTSNNTAADGGAIEWIGSGDKTAVGAKIAATRVESGGKMDLRFYTGRNSDSNHEKMRILANGNIGINTTAPTQGLQLASKNIYMQAGSILMSQGTALFMNASNGGIRHGFHSTGYGFEGTNVGIGTTAPLTKLHVRGASSTDARLLIEADSDAVGGEAKLQFKTDSQDADTRIKAAIIFKRDDPGTRGTGDLHFAVEGNNSDTNASTSHTRLMIQSDGNIGIGTTSPSTAKLVVQGADASDVLHLHGLTGTNTRGLKISLSNEGATNQVVNYDSMQANGIHVFKTAGTERMRIHDGGNVGIGTTSPDVLLDVEGSGSLPLFLSRKQSSAGPGVGVGFRQYDSANNLHSYAAIFGVIEDNTNGAEDGGLVFHTSLASTLGERMRITSAGKVGIGTTSPDKELDVVGTLRARDASSLQHQLRPTQLISYGTDAVINAQSSGDDVILKTQGNTRLIANAEGRVGIGTTSPVSTLDVVGSMRLRTTSGYYIYDTSNAFRAAFHDNGSMTRIFADGDGSYAHMTFNGGNVGINTTAPDSKLTVYNDTTGITGLVKLWTSTANNTAADGGAIEWVGSADKTAVGAKIAATRVAAGAFMDLRFYTGRNTDSDHEKMRIDTSGNVGIGTGSPANLLHLRGGAATLEIDSSTNTANLDFDNNSTTGRISLANDDLSIQVGGSQSMRLMSTGNICIGTGNATTAKLVVKGADSSDVLHLHGVTGTNTRGLKISLSGEGATNQVVNYDSMQANGIHVFKTAGTERMRIHDGGNVGIGTNSPDTKLDITTSGVHGLIINQDTASSSVSSRLFFKDSTRTNAILNVNGNLQFRTAAVVGSTSGTVRLEVKGDGGINFNQAYTFPTADGSTGQALITDGSGNITFGSVSAGAASSMVDADGDTKIQVEETSDDDIIRFDTAGSQRMIIDDQGRVGINVASLSKTLTVGGTFSATGEAFFSHFDNTSSSSRMRDNLRLNFGTARTFAILGNSTNMHIRNSSTDVMTFDTSNRVGIGTTSPDKKLTVDGDVKVGNGDAFMSQNVAGSPRSLISLGTDNILRIKGNDSEGSANVISMINGGNVGIGTTSPAGLLHISSGTSGDAKVIIEADTDNNNESDNPRLEFRQDVSFVTASVSLEGEAGDTAVGTLANTLLLDSKGAASSQGIQFATGGRAAAQSGGETASTTRMTILGNGNIGIGTAAPNQGLHLVAKNLYMQSSSVLMNQGASYFLNASNGAMKHAFHSTGYAFEGMKVGIGTTAPARNLHVHQGDSTLSYIQITNTTTGIAGSDGVSFGITSDEVAIWNNRENTDSTISTNNTERIRITSAGNVGIGTTSPDQPLHVVGSDSGIKISSAASDRPHLSLVNGTSEMLRLSANNLYGAIGDSTDGQRYMVFKAGKIGIGNTSPDETFHVTGNIKLSGSIVDSYGEQLSFQLNDLVSYSKHIRAEFGLWARGATARAMGIDGSSTYMGLYTNTTEKVRIDSDGRVLINSTTSIDNFAKLQILGDSSSYARMTMQDVDGTNQKTFFQQSGGGTAITTQNGTSNGFFDINGWNGSATTNFFRIGSTGSVGIGTTNPSKKVHVVFSGDNGLNIDSSDNHSSLYVTSGQGYGQYIRFADDSANYWINADTNGRLNFRPAGTSTASNWISFDASGNAGIGLTTPFTTGGTARLSISTNTNVYLTAGASNSDLIYSRRQGVGHYQTQAYYNDNVGTIEHNPYGGKVGIGTAGTVSSTLQVEALGIDTTTTSTSATTQVAIDTFAAATFRSAEFTIQVKNSTDSTYHLTKVLLIHDGTTPAITEYGTIFTGSAAEATFDADISSGNVRLLATPASTDSMTFKVVRHCITV